MGILTNNLIGITSIVDISSILLGYIVVVVITMVTTFTSWDIKPLLFTYFIETAPRSSYVHVIPNYAGGSVQTMGGIEPSTTRV